MLLISACYLYKRHLSTEAINQSGCFHTSTFGAHPGSIDVRFWFIWMMWRLSSDLGCAPVNRTRVCVKGRPGVRFKWTPVRFAADLNAIAPNRRSEPLLMSYYLIKCVFVCVFHSLSWQVWLKRCKQRAVCLIYVRLQRSLEHLQYIRKTDVSVLKH